VMTPLSSRLPLVACQVEVRHTSAGSWEVAAACDGQGVEPHSSRVQHLGEGSVLRGAGGVQGGVHPRGPEVVVHREVAHTGLVGTRLLLLLLHGRVVECCARLVAGPPTRAAVEVGGADGAHTPPHTVVLLEAGSAAVGVRHMHLVVGKLAVHVLAAARLLPPPPLQPAVRGQWPELPGGSLCL
jgi:hypothetical protein